MDVALGEVRRIHRVADRVRHILDGAQRVRGHRDRLERRATHRKSTQFIELQRLAEADGLQLAEPRELDPDGSGSRSGDFLLRDFLRDEAGSAGQRPGSEFGRHDGSPRVGQDRGNPHLP